MYRQGLFRARVKLGRTALTYQEFASEGMILADLANLCLNLKEPAELKALLDAHRKARPEDPDLPLWEVDLRWLREDYAGVLDYLTEHRDRLLARPAARWRVNDKKVRALVKLKKIPEAIAEADQVEKARGDALLVVLAHAASGDVKNTIAALERLRPDFLLIEDCYRDPDLGPLLRGDTFAPFRARFPEPRNLAPL